MSRAAAIVALASISLLGASAPASVETLTYRTFSQAANVQSIDVGDAQGHLLGITHQSGIAAFSDGTFATTYFTAAFDYTNGSGQILVTYNNITFDDGSELWLKSTGTAVANGQRTNIKGTLSVVGGKGRYDGATGQGTFSGVRLAPLAAGADLYLDNTLEVKK